MSLRNFALVGLSCIGFAGLQGGCVAAPLAENQAGVGQEPGPRGEGALVPPMALDTSPAPGTDPATDPPAPAPRPINDTPAAPEAAPPAASRDCDLNMNVGVRITVDVGWDGGIAIEEGSGQLVLWYRGDVSHQGNQVLARGRVCGISIPEFQNSDLVGGGRTGTRWPERFWELPSLPRADLNIQLGDSQPGASLDMAPWALTLGAHLADPLNEPWPSRGRDLETVDHDGDGRPGVTTLAATGNGYEFPRVALLDASLRADKLYLATRTILELDGQLDSCDAASGSAFVEIDQHVVGCHVDGRDECSRSQVDLIDRNLPTFDVYGASFELQRMPDSYDCDAIMAELP